MKRLLKWIVIVTVTLSGLLVTVMNDNQEVFIASKESKSTNGSPVFNKILWFQFQDKDVWMMQQSHHGPTAGDGLWDRLAIVIDKTQSPKTARFYQLEPGPLKWEENLKEKPFRVSCFMCHNNGPRAIRAFDNTPNHSTSVKDKIKIAFWNLRIKSYGRVVASPLHEKRDQLQVPPFRYRSTYENEPVRVKACTRCHNESGFFSRGELTRQHALTMKFLVDAEQMPPFGFSISAQERADLENFLNGF